MVYIAGWNLNITYICGSTWQVSLKNNEPDMACCKDVLLPTGTVVCPVTHFRDDNPNGRFSIVTMGRLRLDIMLIIKEVDSADPASIPVLSSHL